jgi:hypothetical protein
MVLLYQRILIASILLIAFAGRVAVCAIPMLKPNLEIVKDKPEGNDADEKDQQVEEKIKLEYLITNGLTNIDFLSMACAKTKLFAGDYRLLKCCLQALEYPPK